LHYTFILKILVQTRLAKAFTDASGKYDLSFELDKQAGISVKAYPICYSQSNKDLRHRWYEA